MPQSFVRIALVPMLVIAGAIALLTGVAGASPAGDPGEDIDACALVSHEEAEALAATPLEPALPSSGACSYAGVVGGPTAQVEVYVGDGAESYYDIDQDLGELVPNADLGDEGYLAPSGDVVYFQQSGVWVVIRVVRLEGEYAQPLEALARNVAASGLVVGGSGTDTGTDSSTPTDGSLPTDTTAPTDGTTPTDGSTVEAADADSSDDDGFPVVPVVIAVVVGAAAGAGFVLWLRRARPA